MGKANHWLLLLFKNFKKSGFGKIISMFSSSRRLHKVAHWFEGAETQSKLLATYILKNSGNVHAMSLLPGEFLYMAGEDDVSQYFLAQCLHYATCAQCAIDPYCSWNSARGFCYKREQTHKSAVGYVNLSFYANFDFQSFLILLYF